MLNSSLCQRLGIEFPLFAFSHCRDVVVAVSKAGGMGVLGVVGMRPTGLREELDWIDAHVGGKPYGVDLIVPNKYEGKGEAHDLDKLLAAIPAEHKDFAASILARARHRRRRSSKRTPQRRRLGAAICATTALPPARSRVSISDQADRQRARHAAAASCSRWARSTASPSPRWSAPRSTRSRKSAAGVDIIIAAGSEAGGHCGEVIHHGAGARSRATRCDAIGVDTPVLAAGGIVTGAQMAAAMAMGAAGAWCGSVWLTTPEAETSPVVKQKMLAATSRDTVRSRSRTGKPSRQLRSPWTDAWESEDAPKPLPMPLQTLRLRTAAALDRQAQRRRPRRRAGPRDLLGRPGRRADERADVSRRSGAAIQGRLRARVRAAGESDRSLAAQGATTRASIAAKHSSIVRA